MGGGSVLSGIKNPLFVGSSRRQQTGELHWFRQKVYWCFRHFSPPRLLLAKGQRVRDHGDELRIGGLALDVRHRIAEVLLQHLDVAPVPGHLDGVADFQGLRPERGRLALALPEASRSWTIYCFIYWFDSSLLMGMYVWYHKRRGVSNFHADQHHQIIHKSIKSSRKTRTFLRTNTNSDCRTLAIRLASGFRCSYFFHNTNYK